MNNIKRTGILLLILAVAAFVGGSFGGSEILERAIIVGIGIDKADGEKLQVTAEVISPGNGSEQIGTYSKMITVTGGSIAEAIKNIAAQVGKEASLGQCLILILGEEYYSAVNCRDLITYFINSDSFRENAVICCCKGTAKDLMNKGDALSQSVSLAISAKLLSQAGKVGLPTNNLLTFTRSQMELSKSGFLNLVEFIESENKDETNPDKPQGFFRYNKTVIFKNSSFAYEMNPKETRGFALLKSSVLGDSFVSSASGELLTVNVNNKKVGSKYSEGEIAVNVELSVNLARTDSANQSGSFTFKESKFISEEMLADIKEQAQNLISSFLQTQMEHDFDIVNLHEYIRQKEGDSEELDNLSVKDIPVKFTVKVEEK